MSTRRIVRRAVVGATIVVLPFVTSLAPSHAVGGRTSAPRPVACYPGQTCGGNSMDELSKLAASCAANGGTVILDVSDVGVVCDWK